MLGMNLRLLISQALEVIPPAARRRQREEGEHASIRDVIGSPKNFGVPVAEEIADPGQELGDVAVFGTGRTDNRFGHG